MLELGMELGFAFMLADFAARLRMWRAVEKAQPELAASFAERGPGNATSHPFERAIAWFRARVPLLDGPSADNAALAHRRQGFVAAIDMATRTGAKMNQVFAKVLRTGESFPDFKAAAVKIFKRGGLELLTDARLQTIYRTGLQSAYDAGRMSALRDPRVAGAFPFWVWRTAQDVFVRPAKLKKVADGFKPTTGAERADARAVGDHRALHGVFAHVSHPLSGELSVPAGFNCRCVRVPLSATRAFDLGLIDERGVVLIPVGRLDADFTRVVERAQNPEWRMDKGFAGNRILGVVA